MIPAGIGNLSAGSRLAKLDINREEIHRLNKDVEEVIEDEEDL